MKIYSLFLIITGFTIILSGCKGSEETDYESFWTEKNSPEKVGRIIINDLFSRPDYMMYETKQYTMIHYAEACVGFGAARLARLLKDSEIIDKLVNRYTKALVDDEFTNPANHVDANVYGILPLELYMQTGDERFFKQGIDLADKQWEDPLPDGLTNQTRFWIDDVWMIGSLQVQAFRATGRKIYLTRAALEIAAYLNKLQQPNGLFYHGQNAPFFWGRGNGWVAAGLAELLSELPADNPQYKSIEDGYSKMMNALLEYQSDDGMWRQLINVEESWKETSSSAMFGYAITIGIKKGILSKSLFTPIYQKAWNSLVEYINDEGKLTDVCVGTGQSTDINYYLNRPRATGDLHGHAPMLWFAYQLLTE